MRKLLTKKIRNTTFFAYCQGFSERRRYGDDAGRTHPINQDWNEAYDRGQNMAEWTAKHIA